MPTLEDSYFGNYPVVYDVFRKVAFCGTRSLVFLDDKGETRIKTAFCDNRVCKNPKCQKHRAYKFIKTHHQQISVMEKSIRKPKGWVFSTPRMSFPIDRGFLNQKMKLLYDILDISRHQNFGSVTEFSIHMEIVLHSPCKDYPLGSWYLHFHVMSGGIKNLRLIRNKIWGYWCSYKESFNKKFLIHYFTKYVRKPPHVTNRYSLFEYCRATHKLQMHRFSVGLSGLLKSRSGWVLIDITKNIYLYCVTFGEMIKWFGDYLTKEDRPPPPPQPLNVKRVVQKSLLVCSPVVD